MVDPQNHNSFLNGYMNMSLRLESGFMQIKRADSFLTNLPETLEDSTWASNIAAIASNSVGPMTKSLMLINSKFDDIDSNVSFIDSNTITAMLGHIDLVGNGIWFTNSCAFASNALTSLNNDETASWASNILESSHQALLRLNDANVLASNDVSTLIRDDSVTRACNLGTGAFYANAETATALSGIMNECIFLQNICHRVSNCLTV